MRLAAHAMLLCVARSFRAPLRASPPRRSLARSAAPRRIDSTKNDFVKLCKTLHRRRGREQTNLVFLEGQRLVGGDTVFHATAKSECARVSPEAGMALLHAHGRRCLMHEGEEITRGAKYLLRADVMYRRVRDDG